MAQRYVSQLDVTTDVRETTVTENDLLNGSHPIKVTAYSAETVLPAATAGAGNNYAVELLIGEREKIGQGTFGKVYRAQLINTQEIVAIKEVEIQQKVKSRELDILKMIVHPNIVRLKYFFHTLSIKNTLYLIMEYMPMSAHQLITDYRRNQKILPVYYIKLFSYQMLRGLGYLHVKSIAHRDLKPANMIVDFDAGLLKICDLGSAKTLNRNEKSISYVCTRHYRAPELLLGVTEYTTSVDIWSAGCCIAEFLNGYALFRGTDTSDQMYRIIKILGIPTRDELNEMNPRYTGTVDLTVFSYTALTLRGYLPQRTQEAAFVLLEQLIKYRPSDRLSCQAALASEFFVELRNRSIQLPNQRNIPPLFNFREDELPRDSQLYSAIVPDFARNSPPNLPN